MNKHTLYFTLEFAYPRCSYKCFKIGKERDFRIAFLTYYVKDACSHDAARLHFTEHLGTLPCLMTHLSDLTDLTNRQLQHTTHITALRHTHIMHSIQSCIPYY